MIFLQAPGFSFNKAVRLAHLNLITACRIDTELPRSLRTQYYNGTRYCERQVLKRHMIPNDGGLRSRAMVDASNDDVEPR